MATLKELLVKASLGAELRRQKTDNKAHIKKIAQPSVFVSVTLLSGVSRADSKSDDWYII